MRGNAIDGMKQCKRGHAMTPENSGSGGTCKTCRREYARARRAGTKIEPVPLGTHCSQGHELTEENVYRYRNVRQCRICRAENNKVSYRKHKEKRLAWHKARREADPEAHREASRKWLRENRERANLTNRIKKQRRRAAGTLTVADWRLVLEVYGSTCLACGKDDVTIDHVVPISAGGANSINNVQPLCGRCNTSKGTKTIDFRPAPLSELVG